MVSNVKLIIDNQEHKLEVVKSNCGPSAINVSSLYKESGYLTYDPGFMSTAYCKSEITFIEGEKEVLWHRGYSIEELSNGSYSFCDVFYLLLHGSLPSEKKKMEVEEQIKRAQSPAILTNLKQLITLFPSTAHPMSILRACVSFLSSDRRQFQDAKDKEFKQGIDIFAKMPIIIAYIHRHLSGQAFIEPEYELSYCENFLHMMFDEYSQRDQHSQIIDKILILHADHEQNASTAVLRVTASTQANMFDSIDSAIGALSGWAHGGANEEVIKMLEEMLKYKRSLSLTTKQVVNEYINRAKDKNKNFRLMGFGHRIYKNYDPRAHYLRLLCQEFLQSQKDHPDQELFDLTLELEKAALEDQYFIEKKLFPNLDLYSGIIMRALKIPAQMFTTIFALGRTAGWVAQWHEMMNDKEQKIIRPRQVYIGNNLLK